jgi:hypothetical protein
VETPSKLFIGIKVVITILHLPIFSIIAGPRYGDNETVFVDGYSAIIAYFLHTQFPPSLKCYGSPNLVARRRKVSDNCFKLGFGRFALYVIAGVLPYLFDDTIIWLRPKSIPLFFLPVIRDVEAFAHLVRQPFAFRKCTIYTNETHFFNSTYKWWSGSAAWMFFKNR